MESVDTKTLVHVGTELVVVGGLAFWFQRKTSLMQEEINQLKEKVTSYEQIMNKYEAILARHDQILRNTMGIPPQGSQFQGTNPGMQTPHQNVQRTPSQNNHNQQTPNNYHQSRTEIPKEHKEEQFEEESGGEEIPDEELDALMDGELKDLKTMREKQKEPDFIEIDCEGESCEIKAPISRLKKKKKRKEK